MSFATIKNNFSNSPKNAFEVTSQCRLIPAKSAPGYNKTPTWVAGPGDEPPWKIERAGCSQTRGHAPARGQHRSHTGSFSGSHTTTRQVCGWGLLRRKPGATPNTPAPGTDPCMLGVRAASPGSSQTLRASAKSGWPGAQRGPCHLEKVCSFFSSVLLGKGKTNGNGFRSSRGFPANLQRSDKQICILVLANLFSIGFNQLRGVLGRGSEPIIG